MANEQSREQLVAELAALRLRIQALESRGSTSRRSPGKEAAPSAAEKLLRDSADGMFGVDADGRVIFFNAAASSVTGWPLDDALGTPVADLLTPVGSQAAHPVASVLEHGATEHFDSLAFIANDGSEIDLRLNVAPLLVDGAIAGAVGSFSLRDEEHREQPADLSISQFDALLDVAGINVSDEAMPFEDIAVALLDPLVVAAAADRAVLMITEQPGGEPGVLLIEAPEGSLPPGPERPPIKRTKHKNAVANTTLSVPHVGDVGVNALAALPLNVGGRVVGMLTLVSSHEDHFDSARVAMLTTVVERLSQACARREWARESVQLAESSETMFAMLRILAGQGGGSTDKANELLRLASDTVGGQHAALLGPDRPGAQLRWLVGALVGANLDPSHVAHSIVGRVQIHKAAVSLPDASSDPVVRLIDEEAVSAVAVPVTNEGQLIGVLVAASNTTRVHPPSELRLMTAIGAGLGTVMANARLDRQVAESMDTEYQRLESVRSAAEQLSILSPDNALQHLVDAARESIGTRFGGVAVWGPTGSLKTIVGSGWPNDRTSVAAANNPDLNDVLGLMRFALVQERKRVIRVNESPFAGNGEEDRPAIRNLLGLPFKCSDGGTGGFFLVDKKLDASFSPEDERLLGLFSAMASVLLDNIRLYTTEERHRSMLEAVHGSMAEGLIVLTGDGQVLSCNPAALELLSTTENELNGKSLRAWVLRSIDRFASRDVAELLAREIETAEATELEIVTSGPTRRDIAVQVFPIAVGTDEHLTGMLLRDVTEEREYERRRDTFVSVASHELRTPMTTVMGFTELLLTGHPTPDRQRLWLGHIYDDSQRVIDIVDDLLDVSKIQSGKVNLDLQPFHIGTVLNDSMEKLSRISDIHSLEVEVPDALPFVFADESKMSQIVTNLITNAIKYSPRGGTVHVAAWHDTDNGQTVFSVSDQGMGIAEADQARLFNTFQRIHTKETERIRGTGLGLYIVKSLAESMGGTVWLRSEISKGSTFYVGFPAHEVTSGGTLPVDE